MENSQQQQQQPISPIMSSRTSYDSDRTSTTVSGLTNHFSSSFIHVNPAPAYIGHAGASQAVSELQVSRPHASSDPVDQDGPSDFHFSDSALALMNAFLDQLLYSFLSSARSTSLPALRPAVADVLKHRLAKEATSNADAELFELLGGAEDEEQMDSRHESQETKRRWDLELVWKRTRLRVMVYMRLGEMEDEDEQRYVEREELFHGTERSFSSTSGLVAWSAAIFLTSVLEYVAEQCLVVAGQATQNRVRRESRSRPSTPSAAEHAGSIVVVEEHDVEKIALNPALGRLWRTWRKAMRNQGVSVRPSSSSISRGSRDNMASRTSHYTDAATNDSRPMSRDQQDEIPEAEYPEYILAANIPLPMSNARRDVDEIVAVGLARDPDNAAEDDDDLSDSSYPEHVLAPLIPLPMQSEQRDLDEIIVPGLARDPDAQEDPGHLLNEPYPALALALLIALPSIDLKRDVDEIEVPGLAKDPDAAVKDAHRESQRRNSFAGIATTSRLDGLASSDASMPPVVRPRSMSVPTTARIPMHAEETPADEASEKTAEAGDNAAGEPAMEQAQDDEKAPTELQRAEDNKPDDQAPVGHDRISNGEATLIAAGMVAAAGTVGVAATALSSLKSTEGFGAAEKRSATASSGRPSFPDGEDEQVDKRKSLGDMKSLLSNNELESTDSVQQKSRIAGLQAPGVSRLPSDDSYTLVDPPQEKSPARYTGMNGIGVAQTTEAPVAGRQTKEPGTRFAGPPLNELSRRSEESTPKDDPTPRTPRTFLDLTEEGDDDDHAATGMSDKDMISPSKSKDATEQASGVGRASPPKTPSAMFVPPRPSQAKNSLESTGVQEHPVVQRMASLKGSEPHSSSGSESALPLTSAAIRGPEDFDTFVQGGETLKYTLTPEGVRDVPVGTGARQSPIEMDGSKGTRSSADSRSGMPRFSFFRDSTSPTSEGRSVTRPSPRNAGAGSRNGLLAREPQVLTESTRDFADFIRSTGPNGASMVTPAALGASPAPTRSANLPGATNASRAPPSSTRAKSNMQPREAKAETDGSSDLIDFIRSGPSEPGQHRISRSVAPFRTTMDSDQFDNLGARPSADTQAQSVLSASSQYESSFRTSTNSRSALLNGTNNSINQTAPLSQNGNSVSSRGVLPEPEPTGRKQYRNKDPYALDFDDDFGNDHDDFLESVVPQKNNTQAHRGEESMFDFLRNHDPTPTGPPKPLINPNSPQARRLIQEARERAKNPSPTARSAILPRDSPTTDPPRAPTPQFAGTYQPTRPKMEARSPVVQGQGADTSTTNDLADFLKNSGPLYDGNGAPAPGVGAGAGGARTSKTTAAAAAAPAPTKKKSGIFGLPKRKTYLDMP